MRPINENNMQLYLNEISEQVKWLEVNSERNRKRYRASRTIQIVSGIFITLSTGFMAKIGLPLELCVGFLGAVVSALHALLELFKYKDNWLAYQNTAELLKSEKRQFITRTNPYNKQNANCVFVRRVEGIRAQHNKTWNQFMNVNDDHSNNSNNNGIEVVEDTVNPTNNVEKIRSGKTVKNRETA
ncbi:MAG: DUF4231 domain-containing protein [Rubrobacteridae bacterium]|nr:DUF4231 domain-containing protein [Rubrobacteridae bacterium]